MATYPTVTDAVGNVDAATFIPEIWSDEVIASYESNLVVAPLVKKISMVGKKGDTINIPKPDRGTASAKAAATGVTIIAHTDTNLQVSVDQHFEYTRMIEDIADVQAVSSLRKFYTEDAGYALAQQLDSYLLNSATFFGNAAQGNATPTTDGANWVNSASFYNNGDTPTTYTVDTVEDTDVFTDAYFRAMIQKQDDADTPMANRFLVITPSVKKAMTGTTVYTSSDFVSGRPVVNGLLGNLYGIDIFVSTNVPVAETAAANTSVTSTQDVRANILAHRDTYVLAEQKGVRSQTQYKQEYLSTMYTADRIYGAKVCRPESGFIMAIPN